MEERINAALEDVKQILARDGGSIELVDVTEDNIARVRLLGHCTGCPGARMTLKGIVEQILAQSVPEIKGVEAVD
jgi:Fe-S cluster biogenesis protein NfuA